LEIKNLKRRGCMVFATKTTENIPMIEIRPMDLSAGCFAKTKTPMPIIVVEADRNIEVL
jgi:hypothetical protein